MNIQNKVHEWQDILPIPQTQILEQGRKQALKMGLTETAEDMGRRNDPNPTATDYTEVELGIINGKTKEIVGVHSDGDAKLNAGNQALAELIDEKDTSEEVMPKIEAETLTDEKQREIVGKKLVKQAVQKEGEHDELYIKYDPDPSLCHHHNNKWKPLFIGVVLFMVDTIIGAFLYEGASSFAYLGGTIYAGLAATFLIAIGLATGVWGRNINYPLPDRQKRPKAWHETRHKKIFGGFVIAVGMIAAWPFILMTGHYRDDLNADKAAHPDISIFWRPYEWFQLDDILSFFLMGLSTLIFAIAALEGSAQFKTSWARLPDLARRAREKNAALAKLDRFESKSYANIDKILNDCLASYEAEVERAVNAEIHAGRILTDARKTKEVCERSMTNLFRVMDYLVKYFQEHNEGRRVEPAPPYFSETLDINDYVPPPYDLTELEEKYATIAKIAAAKTQKLAVLRKEILAKRKELIVKIEAILNNLKSKRSLGPVVETGGKNDD